MVVIIGILSSSRRVDNDTGGCRARWWSLRRCSMGGGGGGGGRGWPRGGMGGVRSGRRPKPRASCASLRIPRAAPTPSVPLPTPVGSGKGRVPPRRRRGRIRGGGYRARRTSLAIFCERRGAFFGRTALFRPEGRSTPPRRRAALETRDRKGPSTNRHSFFFVGPLKSMNAMGGGMEDRETIAGKHATSSRSPPSLPTSRRKGRGGDRNRLRGPLVRLAIYKPDAPCGRVRVGGVRVGNSTSEATRGRDDDTRPSTVVRTRHDILSTRGGEGGGGVTMF